jgi:type IV secretory pathway VirB10-like protein
MRSAILIVAALALSGCSDSNFYGDSPDRTTMVASAPVQAPSEPSPAEATAAPMQQPAPAPSDAATAPAEQTPVAQAAPESPAPVAQATPSSSAHCTMLAKQRARDAAFEGEDADTQEAVYNRTYSDCVAWDLKHAFR